MLLRLFLCAFLFLTSASAQLRRSVPEPARVPSAKVAVSADGLTVAVARSSASALKPLGRVELWNTSTGELKRTITGFDGPIWSLTFSPDGRSLITVSTEFRESKIQAPIKDREARILAELKWWDTQTGEFIRKVSLSDERVVSLEATWSPAGDLLALIERTSEVHPTQVSARGALNQPLVIATWVNVEGVDLKVLDAQTGQRRVKVEDVAKTYQGALARRYARLEHPVFSPDGSLLAASLAGEVNLWSVATGKRVRTIKKVMGWPSAIAFSHDNRRLAVAGIKGMMPGGESEISIWEVSSGEAVNKLKGKNDLIACLQFAAQGRALLIGSLQYEPAGAMGTVKMWDLRENRMGRFIVHENEAVSSLTLIPNLSAVVLQSGSQVELRDTKTWQVRHSFASTEENESESMRRSRFLLSANRALAVAFSRDGTTVAAEIPGEGLRRWDSRTGGLKPPVQREQSSEAAVVAMSTSGDFVAEASAQEVRITNLLNGTSNIISHPVAGPISAIALSRDGQLLAVGTGVKIALLRLAQGAPAMTLEGATDFISFSEDGRTLATADLAGLVQVWDTNSGSLRSTIDIGQKITAIAIDASGQLLASAQADYSIKLWDLNTGALRDELKKHQNVINALAFSSDGKTLASGGDDRTAILWDIAASKSKRTLKGHDLTVTSLAFSPDGVLLASGSGNAAVVLWNVASGKLDRVLR